jgi:hypothetical protein
MENVMVIMQAKLTAIGGGQEVEIIPEPTEYDDVGQAIAAFADWAQSGFSPMGKGAQGFTLEVRVTPA